MSIIKKSWTSGWTLMIWTESLHLWDSGDPSNPHLCAFGSSNPGRRSGDGQISANLTNRAASCCPKLCHVKKNNRKLPFNPPLFKYKVLHKVFSNPLMQQKQRTSPVTGAAEWPHTDLTDPLPAWSAQRNRERKQSHVCFLFKPLLVFSLNSFSLLFWSQLCLNWTLWSSSLDV